MGRRQAATPESDPSEHATPASKRSRADVDSEDEDQPKGRNAKKVRIKGYQQQRDDESENDDEDFIENEEDELFDAANRDAVLAAMEARRKFKGSIAEHGIIESIEMHQFMCHKYLTFDFGPQINFIIGHNGSGKSAVLSAITVALGGKANSTGRGSGLKSFIREGQSAAEVTISIKNQGEEAFKHKEYGDSIVITRKFTKEGSSSWKIKSKDGRVISTKRDELSAICDHMNIQVDNPMNVLTQDAARQFLSASHPADKYKFFLRGTQLSQLSDEYDTCQENISATAGVLQQKKEALPDLKTAAKEASIRYEEAKKAREQKKKVDDLKRELAWAHVAGKEQELTAKVQEAEKAKRVLPKLEASLAEAKSQEEEASTEVKRVEEEIDALGNINHLDERRKDLRKTIQDNKRKLTEFTTDIRQVEASIKSFNLQIDGYQKQIEDEAKRMAADTQAKREESQRNLAAARTAVDDAQARVNDVNNEMRNLSDTAARLRTEGMNKEAEIEQLKRKIGECDAFIHKVAQLDRNSLAAYGNDIKALLDEIARTKWFGEVPVGPLGLFIKVREPEKWADLLRTQLRGLLTAFAVTDTRDRRTLSGLLQRSKNANMQIVITKKDIFDFSHGEPPENFLTVLRALEISDPFVVRILINQMRIERTLLGRSRQEGEQLLRQLDGGGTAWTPDGFRLIRFPEGGENTQTLNIDRRDGGGLLSTAKSDAAEKEKALADKQRFEQDVLEHIRLKDDGKQKWTKAQHRLDELKAQARLAHTTLSAAKSQLSTLQQEANNEMPANIGALEEAKREAESEKEGIFEQFRTIIAAKEAVDSQNRNLLNQSNELKKQIDEFDDRRKGLSAQAEEALQERMKALNSVQHWQKKIEEQGKTIKGLEDAVLVLQEEYTTWTEKAEQYCARVPNPRKAAEIDILLKSTQAALAEREKRQGASVETLLEELNRAKEKFETVERDWRQMAQLNKILRASLNIRFSRWQEFRRHIALRCKYVFQYHLSQRGFFGKVLFDHSKSTLQLKVQTDDLASQGAREKDARSLSGGEKSFSTICLLLSLWESIGCPLRCLDEFDVFMDAINRRISMKMMIETADQSDKKQYILITPQDMGNIKITDSIKVNRMTDPERGLRQETLQF